jgi:hypothetical protein
MERPGGVSPGKDSSGGGPVRVVSFGGKGRAETFRLSVTRKKMK